jgi:hypothetical protein
MKKNFLLAIISICPLLLLGQSSPIQFFDELPHPPSGVCNMRGEFRGQFLTKLLPYRHKLDEELKYLTKDEKKNKKQLEDDMTKKVAADFNMSPEEIQKLRNTKKMTKAQKDSIANKMLMQSNMNLSIEEMRDAKKMTKEGKKAWATSIANEQSAEIQGNPTKFTRPDTSSRTAADIAKEINELQIELGSGAQRSDVSLGKKTKDTLQSAIVSGTVLIGQKMDEIEMDTSRTKRLKEMKEIRLEADTLIGDDAKPGGKKDMLMQKLRNMQISYCNVYASKYEELLSQYRNTLSINLAKYNQLDKLLNEQNRKLTGSDVNMVQPGYSAYRAIEQYFGRLSEVFRYAVYDPQWWDNWEASKKTGEEGN